MEGLDYPVDELVLLFFKDRLHALFILEEVKNEFLELNQRGGDVASCLLDLVAFLVSLYQVLD